MMTKEILLQLTNVADAENSQNNVSVAAEKLLSAYGKTTVDPMGNLLMERDGQGRHFLLDAHLDEVSFVVTGLEEGGFVRVAKYGGIDIRSLPAKQVTLWGSIPIQGVFTANAPHLSKGEDYKKAVPLEELSVDTGRPLEELQTILSLGDRVTFAISPAELLNGCVTGKSLDDRAGMAVILRTLDLLKETDCSAHITVLFSVQEELGTRGAVTGAFGVQPDEAVAVDVSFALQPDAPAHKCGKLSNGPMIGISPILSKTGYQKMEALAKELSIPYQLEVMAGETGTNADMISLTQSGIPTSLLSIPLRSMHTPAELVDAEDLENTARLLAAYISSFDEQ